MKKIFEFVNLGGAWFYWAPEYDGPYEDLQMIGGADLLLYSLDNKFVRLQIVDKATAKIVLSKKEDSEFGATYLCRSKNYNGDVYLCPVTLSVLGEYPPTIYLREV